VQKESLHQTQAENDPEKPKGSNTDQNLLKTEFMVLKGETTMPEQIDNLEVIKREDETVLDEAARNQIDRVAEKAAEKASRTEQDYDRAHQIVSK
jgi:hypothetical protein